MEGSPSPVARHRCGAVERIMFFRGWLGCAVSLDGQPGCVLGSSGPERLDDALVCFRRTSSANIVAQLLANSEDLTRRL